MSLYLWQGVSSDKIKDGLTKNITLENINNTLYQDSKFYMALCDYLNISNSISFTSTKNETISLLKTNLQNPLTVLAKNSNEINKNNTLYFSPDDNNLYYYINDTKKQIMLDPSKNIKLQTYIINTAGSHQFNLTTDLKYPRSKHTPMYILLFGGGGSGNHIGGGGGGGLTFVEFSNIQADAITSMAASIGASDQPSFLTVTTFSDEKIFHEAICGSQGAYFSDSGAYKAGSGGSGGGANGTGNTQISQLYFVGGTGTYGGGGGGGGCAFSQYRSNAQNYYRLPGGGGGATDCLPFLQSYDGGKGGGGGGGGGIDSSRNPIANGGKGVYGGNGGSAGSAGLPGNIIYDFATEQNPDASGGPSGNPSYSSTSQGGGGGGGGGINSKGGAGGSGVYTTLGYRVIEIAGGGGGGGGFNANGGNGSAGKVNQDFVENSNMSPISYFGAGGGGGGFGAPGGNAVNGLGGGGGGYGQSGYGGSGKQASGGNGTNSYGETNSGGDGLLILYYYTEG